MPRPKRPGRYRAARGHDAGLPFLSLLTEACADARIPVPLPERGRPVTGMHVSPPPLTEPTEVRRAAELGSLSSVVPVDAAVAEESTVWDPSPPAAMQRPPPRPRRRPAAARAEDRPSRRAAEIFARARAAYLRGDLHQARADVMLARVFDPANPRYADAERTWRSDPEPS